MALNLKKIILPKEKDILADWLSNDHWPFHGKSKVEKEKVFTMIENGFYDSEAHQTFWIQNVNEERIGFIRLFDLDDIPDGEPLFDIRFKTEHRRKGYGTEAIQWLVQYMFNTWQDLRRISATTRVDNIAMRTVLNNCFFTKEAHYRKSWITEEKIYLDTVQYGLLREDWINKKITAVNWNT